MSLGMVESAHSVEKLQQEPDKFDVKNGIFGLERDVLTQLSKKVAKRRIEIFNKEENLRKELEKFNVKNGLVGLERDIFFQLTEKIAEKRIGISNRENNIRNMYGTSGKAVEWLSHPYYPYYIKSLRLSKALESWQDIEYPHKWFRSEIVCNSRALLLYDEGEISCSENNGKSWDIFHSSQRLYRLTSAGNKFIAYHGGNAYGLDTVGIAISDNGKTWTTCKNTNDIMDIIYTEKNNFFWGINKKCNIFRNSDVTQLVADPSSIVHKSNFTDDVLKEYYFLDVCGNSDGSILVARMSNSRHYSAVYKNGRWEKITISPDGHVCNMAHNGSCFAAVAFNKKTGFDIWTSKDGSTWAKSCNFAMDSHMHNSSVLPFVINCDGYFVAQCDNTIYVSHDGLKWNMANKIDGVDNDNYIKDLVYNRGRFFIATRNSIKASKIRDIVDNDDEETKKFAIHQYRLDFLRY
jgi:hypothetical protein